MACVFFVMIVERCRNQDTDYSTCDMGFSIKILCWKNRERGHFTRDEALLLAARLSDP